VSRGASLDGRVCLVTGATSGHGRAVALGLAQRGADLVLLGRSAERCARVRAEIAAATGRAPAVLLCDLASRREIDRAADEALSSGRPLHALVNNAGLVSLARRESVDGIELTFAVNYLAMFQLTLRLLPRLLASAPARIVNVSSDTHRIARLDLEDLELRRRYGMLRAYGRSKLAIVLFTRELARRLAGTGVTCNAVDPGPVGSNIGSDNPGLAYRFVGPLIRAFFPSPERAARLAIELVESPALEGRSGEYWRLGKPRRPAVGSESALAPRLWERSESLTGARFAAPPRG
jgi:NAD(P)-dependent dehydrogenase (short-subunit alcohol dehydrogenase family)